MSCLTVDIIYNSLNIISNVCNTFSNYIQFILVHFIIYFTILRTLPHTDASVIVHGSCQSIPLPPSSSETIITSTQSGPTNSPQSVPTYSTLSGPMNSTQRSINQKDDITNLFFRNFFSIFY